MAGVKGVERLDISTTPVFSATNTPNFLPEGAEAMYIFGVNVAAARRAAEAQR
jgi:hypothetical protein